MRLFWAVRGATHRRSASRQWHRGGLTRRRRCRVRTARSDHAAGGNGNEVCVPALSRTRRPRVRPERVQATCGEV